MNLQKLLILVVLVVSASGCKNEKDPYSSVTSKNDSEIHDHPGKKLMEKHCYVCHSPTADHNNRIAPPMIAVKKHYIKNGTSKGEFKAAMQTWIENPSDSTAKMHGAVRRFGLMPKAYFSEETIDKISDYIYDYDIEEPDWFQDHMKDKKGMQQSQRGHGQNKGHGKGKQKRMRQQQGHQGESEADKGLRYALATKAVLGQNLMSKIQKEGTIGALTFCNDKAYPLTDSMATHFNANIKRVSDKARNPENEANPNELVYIKAFKAQIKNNLEIEPLSVEEAGVVHVYYPIITNNLCLQCHGKPGQDIDLATFERLKQLYPNDKAIGYSENEVRGMWHITFD
jgi:cytochrome c553